MLALAIFSLTERGAWIQLWPVPGMGRLVFIPAGVIVFLRGDYVHGAGLVDDSRGNSFGRLLIHVNREVGGLSHCSATRELDPRYSHDPSVAEHSLKDEKDVYNAIEI
jgi:hypothetical protein